MTTALDPLDASRRWLEARGVSIAVRDDGEARIVYTGAGKELAEEEGFTVYSAREMYMYVMLSSEAERWTFHSFKRRFHGTAEWRNVGRHH